MSTRKLRYFVAVAEELHFSRAAVRLFVSQQVLSRQVRELEDAIGTPLLRRSTRAAQLTPAGEMFLDVARDVLSALDAGVAAAAQAGRRETGALRVGFMVGAALQLTGPITEAFAESHPAVDLQLREYGFTDTSAGLLDGTSDVAIIRMPCTVPDLDFEPLFVEPLVACMGNKHPLARRESVRVDELLDEPIVISDTNDQPWQEFWALDRYRSGSPAVIVRHSHSQTEELEHVASGAGISVTAAGLGRALPHRGVRYVPIQDAEGSMVAIGRRAGNPNPLVDAFLAVARTVRSREKLLVAQIENPF